MKIIRYSKMGRKATASKIMLGPHKLTISVLATLQPKVPAPSSRHLADTTLSKSKVGTNLQHINLRFRSTDDSANLKNKRIIYSANHSFMPQSCPFWIESSCMRKEKKILRKLGSKEK